MVAYSCLWLGEVWNGLVSVVAYVNLVVCGCLCYGVASVVWSRLFGLVLFGLN